MKYERPRAVVVAVVCAVSTTLQIARKHLRLIGKIKLLVFDPSTSPKTACLNGRYRSNFYLYIELTLYVGI